MMATNGSSTERAPTALVHRCRPNAATLPIGSGSQAATPPLRASHGNSTDRDRSGNSTERAHGFFGGKGAGGVYQTIINQMPPHRVYIEAFLGSGRVMRMKLPADRNIGIDLDAAAVTDFKFSNLHSTRRHLASVELKVVDAIRWLENFKWSGGELVYLDPPYLLETRSCAVARYKFELTHHERLLRVIKALPCDVMISGYWSELYDRELADWRSINFPAKTRRGMATEWLWMNYPEPTELHDYRYLGANFRERQDIKLQQKRWVKKFLEMPQLQRQALFAAIREAANSQERSRSSNHISADAISLPAASQS